MAIDYWPEQDGVIVKGMICGFCYATLAVNEGEIVTWGTSAASRAAVTPSIAVGDGCGVAMKTVSAGQILPVVFSGIIKMKTTDIVAIGELVINASSIDLTNMSDSNTICINSATRTIMGCVLQAGAAADGDELLVLLGGDGVAHGIT